MALGIGALACGQGGTSDAPRTTTASRATGAAVGAAVDASVGAASDPQLAPASASARTVDLDAGGPEPLLPIPGASVAEGARLHATHCARCHGGDGRGRGPDAAALTHAPTDLTTTAYLCRTTFADRGAPSEADVESALYRGTHAGLAPLTGLSARARRSLTLHARSLAPGFAAPSGVALVVPPEPPDTPESRGRGRLVYITWGCHGCHGLVGDGAGDADLLRMIRWNDRPLAPGALFDDAKFLCGGTPDAVYRTIALGMAAPMPRYAEMAGMLWRPEPGAWQQKLAERLAPDEHAALRAFLDTLPEKQTVKTMDPTARRVRAGAILWDLVHYVRAL